MGIGDWQGNIDYSGGYGGDQYYIQPDYKYDYGGDTGSYDGYDGGGSWLNASNLKAGGTLLSGLGSVASAYTGWQGLKLAKKQFALNKANTLANYRMNAQNYNDQMRYRQNRRNTNWLAAQDSQGSVRNFGTASPVDTETYMRNNGANLDMMQADQGYVPPGAPTPAPQPTQNVNATSAGTAKQSANWLNANSQKQPYTRGV